MNIKEIALKLSDKTSRDMNMCYLNKEWIVAFSEALIAEIQKQNEPVATREWNDKTARYDFNTDGNNEEYLYAFPPSPEQQWQPIETAPKTGAHLAIDIPNDCGRRPYVIVWLDADHPDADGAGWYEHWSFDPVEPTHWLPLPAAPKGKVK